MDYRRINEDIKSSAVDKAAPILLISEELLLLDFYEKRLIESFGADPLDVSVFSGVEADSPFDDEIMNALDTYPMFSPVRVVIVRNHPKLSGRKAKEDDPPASKAKKTGRELPAYIAQLPETARLVFTATAVNKTLSLYKAIDKHGMAYEISRLEEPDLRAFALKRFKKAGVELAPDVLNAFINATGYNENSNRKDIRVDLFMVENDAARLAYYVAAEGRTEVTLSDVEECLPGILHTDDFAMLDAISLGKKAEAIRLLENALAQDEDTMFLLLALFIGHFEIMLGYKELSSAGMNTNEITSALGQRSEWRVRKLGGYAQRFEKRKLEWILGRLYETDSDVKSGNILPRDALTVLLAEI